VSRRKLLIAGVDEAGRGPLAGPVVAAAVVLDPGLKIEGLNDSKKLTARRREQLFDDIQAGALGYAIAQASVEEIDAINILAATMLAMQRAVAGLPPLDIAEVLIDGNRCPALPHRARAIVRGDASEPAISAASILAKVYRDRLMVAMEDEFPGYSLARHKGYPTAVHVDALRRLGPAPCHRRSFAPVRQAGGES
jgi:ribonuclease HII